MANTSLTNYSLTVELGGWGHNFSWRHVCRLFSNICQEISFQGNMEASPLTVAGLHRTTTEYNKNRTQLSNLTNLVVTF